MIVTLYCYAKVLIAKAINTNYMRELLMTNSDTKT